MAKHGTKAKDLKRPKRKNHNRGRKADIGYTRPELKVMRGLWKDLFGENPPMDPRRAFIDTIRERVGAPAYYKAEGVALKQGYFERGNIFYKCQDGREIRLPDPQKKSRRGTVILAIYASQQEPSTPN